MIFLPSTYVSTRTIVLKLNTSTKAIDVAVGVIFNSQRDRVLIAKRSMHQNQGGLWEFPGGKVAADLGETAHQALIRELREEIGIYTLNTRELTKIQHQYAENSVLLHVWYICKYSGIASGKEGQLLRWVKVCELVKYKFPAANQEIINCILRGFVIAEILRKY